MIFWFFYELIKSSRGGWINRSKLNDRGINPTPNYHLYSHVLFAFLTHRFLTIKLIQKRKKLFLRAGKNFTFQKRWYYSMKRKMTSNSGKCTETEFEHRFFFPSSFRSSSQGWGIARLRIRLIPFFCRVLKTSKNNTKNRGKKKFFPSPIGCGRTEYTESDPHRVYRIYI